MDRAQFYTFIQNNSGGHFTIDYPNIAHYVIIEALNQTLAEEIAQGIGIYFNGVRMGWDCGCCGDRWYPPWDSYETPSTFGDPIEKEYVEVNSKREWDGAMSVHYLDGTVKTYNSKAMKTRP